MPPRSVKQIRALERGIAVMRELEEFGALSLDQLFRRTGFPKATLSRILRTLEAERLAAQRIADGKWLANAGLGVTRSTMTKDSDLVQAAAPQLARLCARIIWPSDLSVRDGLLMRLVETSRPHTALIFNKLSIGFKIDFLLSAPGRAYLAFCPDAECRDIIGKLSGRAEYGFLFENDRIQTILKTTRKNGYALRDPLWGGRSQLFRKDFDDGLDAIAVPIIARGGAIKGCVNLVWIQSAVPARTIVERHLHDLQTTARSIAESLPERSSKTS